MMKFMIRSSYATFIIKRSNSKPIKRMSLYLVAKHIKYSGIKSITYIYGGIKMSIITSTNNKGSLIIFYDRPPCWCSNIPNSLH